MGPNCTYTIGGKTYSHDEFKALLLKDAALFDKYVGGRSVPDAPFKTSWPELAMKRMLRFAAQNGYDALSWDTGDTNADRYDLSKQISKVTLQDNSSGGIGRASMEGSFEHGQLRAYDHSGREVMSKHVNSEEEIVDAVGKDVAEKLLNQSPAQQESAGFKVRHREVAGLDLRVGGEGMRGFYDDILPKTVGKLVKKWGAKVENGGVPPKMKARYLAEPYGGSYRVRDVSPGSIDGYVDAGPFSRLTDAENWIRDNEAVKVPTHSVAITPAMRESVLQSQPMFQRGAPMPRSDSTGNVEILGQGLLGRMPAKPTQAEIDIIDQVNKIAQQIVPTVKVVAARELVLAQGGDNVAIHGGYVSGARQLIAWSLGSPDPVGTMKHEAIHYLRNLGFFTPKEWDALASAALDGGWLKKHDVDARWPNSDHADKIEEAIAEEFAAWKDNRVKPEAGIRRLFARIGEMLDRTRRLIKGLFGQAATPNEIFRDIADGRVGRREPKAFSLDRLEEVFTENPDIRAQVSKLPSNMTQQGDRLDKTSDALADAIKGSAPGTYERTLNAMAPPSGAAQFKHANMLEKHLTLFPHTIAKLDTMSGEFWRAWQARGATQNRIMSEARELIAKTFLKLDEAGRRNVYAVEELDRINQTVRADDGRSIVVENANTDTAHFSKPGDTVILSPQQTKAYFERKAMFRHQWDGLMEGAARRMGWLRKWSPAMADNIELMERAVEEALHPRDRKAFQRLADVMRAMDDQRKTAYVPLMRFGDYYISITAKPGTDMSTTGGFPKTEWFELVESPAMSEWLGQRHKSGDVPKHARDKIADLQKRFPPGKYRIEHGWMFQKADMLRKLDIPAIEKLLTLMEGGVLDRMVTEGLERGASKANARSAANSQYDKLFGEMVDELRDQMYEELRAGFKKRSRTIPGYSDDWDRITGAYMNWTARNIADQLHQEEIERQYLKIQDNHPSAATRAYWESWRNYQEQPSDAFSRMGNGASRLGFIYTLAGNISSAVINSTDPIISAIPALSMGVGMQRAAAEFTRASKDAMAAMRSDTTRGLYIDPQKAAKTKDERDLLLAMEREGQFNPMWVQDMEALSDRQSSMWGKLKAPMRRMLDMASSTMGSTEQGKRIATALAAWRIVKNPANLKLMDQAWGHNQVWRAIKQRDGLSADTMTRFLVSEAAFEWGKENQAPAMRGVIGQAMFLLHGFQVRWLSQALNLLKNSGPDGKKAFLWAMAGLWLGAGIEGLPFAQDAENLADAIWKLFTGKDPMITYRIRAMLVDAGFGKSGAEMIMRGPASTVLGINLADRIGFGDVFSRQFENDTLAGIPLTLFSVLGQRGAAAARRLREGDITGAGRELLPSAARNPVVAAKQAKEGVKTQAGRTVVPKSKVDASDIAARAMGFQPLSQARAYQEMDYRYRAQRSRMGAPKNPIPDPDE